MYEVLITVGNRLAECIRKSDTVARMGGDEFTIIIRNVESKKAINDIVKKIHATLKIAMHIGEIKCTVNSSIGVAIYPDNGKDSEALLRNADSTMYRVKKDGKGGFKFT